VSAFLFCFVLFRFEVISENHSPNFLVQQARDFGAI